MGWQSMGPQAPIPGKVDSTVLLLPARRQSPASSPCKPIIGRGIDGGRERERNLKKIWRSERERKREKYWFIEKRGSKSREATTMKSGELQPETYLSAKSERFPGLLSICIQ